MAKFTTKKMPSLGKVHGGKYYLARRIVNLLPDDTSVFVEPYAGFASVFLNLHPDCYQRAVLSDIAPLRHKVWEAVANDFDRFAALAAEIDYTEENFLRSVQQTWHLYPSKYHDDPKLVQAGGQPMDRESRTRQAVWCWVRSRFSRGGLGDSFAWSDRERGGQPGDVNAWDNARKKLPLLHKRLQDRPVELLNRPAMQLLPSYRKSERATIYLDPPYLHDNRTAREAYGAHELSRKQHIELLQMVRSAQCRVAISGYSCPLYEDMLSDWHRTQWSMPNHAGQSRKKQPRIECLWRSWV